MITSCSPLIVREEDPPPIPESENLNWVTNADIDFAQHFAESIFTGDKWERTTLAAQHDRVMVTWIKANSGNLAYLDYYDEESLLCLQQILFYREMDFSLASIREILSKPEFQVLDALSEHRASLQGRVRRLESLIQTIDETIQYLQGEKEMSKRELFQAFSEGQQEEYAKQAEEKYDSETVRESNRKWKSYSAEKKQTIMDEGNQVYEDMIAAMPKGADSPEAQACVARWRKHMNYFWTPNLNQLLGLATMYGETPAFKKNFNSMHPDLADFMREAVTTYVAGQK